MFGFNIVNRLGAVALDRLGDLNPQLLRELRGRLKWPPVLVAIGLSILVQLGLLIGFSTELPGAVSASSLRLSTYPEIAWGQFSEFAPWFQEQILPLDMADRKADIDPLDDVELAHISGLYIQHLNAYEPALGEKTLGAKVLDQLQVGDRLVAIDGKPLAFYAQGLKPTPSGSHQHWERVNFINHAITQQIDNSSLKHFQAQVNTIVSLTFYRPNRGEFTVKLPRIAVPNESISQYCKRNPLKALRQVTFGGNCEMTPDKQFYRVDWQAWYFDVFNFLTLMVTFSAMVGGVFLLANDIAQEKRQGTLNFLRLSPRSASTILIGKLVGVPIWLYLAIGVSLPLYVFAGIMAGHSLGHLVGFGLTLVSQTLVFYLLALLTSFSTTKTLASTLLPWLLAAGVAMLQWAMCIIIWNADLPKIFWNAEASPIQLSLFFTPFTSWAYFAHVNPQTAQNITFGIFRLNFTEYTVLNLGHAVGLGAVFSHALQRRFNNPGVTLIERRYSYLFTAALATLLLSITDLTIYEVDLDAHIALLVLIGMAYFGVLTIALTPDRQGLQDWARFRHAQGSSSQRLSLWKDLLVGDSSSPIVAIVLNLLLATLLFVGCFLFQNMMALSTKISLNLLYSGALLFIAFMLFPVLFLQVQMLRQHQQSAAGLQAIGRIIPLCLGYGGLVLTSWLVLYTHNPDPELIWGMPFDLAEVVVPLTYLSAMISVLSFIHVRQFIILGESETQMLQRSSHPALKGQ